MTDMPAALVTVQTVAKMLDVSTRHIYRYGENEELDFPIPVNVANRRFYRLEEILAWMDSRPRITEAPTAMRNKLEEASA